MSPDFTHRHGTICVVLQSRSSASNISQSLSSCLFEQRRQRLGDCLSFFWGSAFGPPVFKSVLKASVRLFWCEVRGLVRSCVCFSGLFSLMNPGSFLMAPWRFTNLTRSESRGFELFSRMANEVSPHLFTRCFGNHLTICLKFVNVLASSSFSPESFFEADSSCSAKFSSSV